MLFNFLKRKKSKKIKFRSCGYESKIMLIDEIKIPEAFKRFAPKESKMSKCRRIFNDKGYIDRQIVLDKTGMLIDGYVGYLVCREHNVYSYPVLQQCRGGF